MGIFCDILDIFEDTLGRAPADAKWPDKMKAEGPPKLLRALVNIVVAGLLMLQPSPGKLAGSGLRTSIARSAPPVVLGLPPEFGHPCTGVTSLTLRAPCAPTVLP